jgi:hypothetical protein
MKARRSKRNSALRLLTGPAALGLAVVTLVAACAAPGGSPQPGQSPGTPSPLEPDTPVSSRPDGGSPGTRGDAAPSYPPADSSLDAELTIVVTPDKGQEPVTYRLQCRAGMPLTGNPGAEAAGGDSAAGWEELPDPDLACRAVGAHPELLTEEPDPQRICTEQYGGPQRAKVTGVLNGTDVKASFARANGCEISDWERLQPLFGAAGAVD